METSALQGCLASDHCRQVRPAHSCRLPARSQPSCARRHAARSATRCAVGPSSTREATGRQQSGGRLQSSGDDSDVVDIVAAARRKTTRPQGPSLEQQQRVVNPVSEFLSKCTAAYRIFFPQRNRNLSPKEEGRNRLRMILVADRCAMNPSSLTDMKSSIVAAVSNYVEVEGEELVEVSITTDDDLGTIYSVNVPVKRVKPTARVGLEENMEGLAEVEWDEDDPDADPSSRFPFGT